MTIIKAQHIHTEETLILGKYRDIVVAIEALQCDLEWDEENDPNEWRFIIEPADDDFIEEEIQDDDWDW